MKAKISLSSRRMITSGFVEICCIAWHQNASICSHCFFLFYTAGLVCMRKLKIAVLRQCAKSGCFLYGNHTQPVGDAFIPVRALAPKRSYVVVSPANLGIRVLGPLLPMLGALLIPNSIRGFGSGNRCQAFHRGTRIRKWKQFFLYRV